MNWSDLRAFLAVSQLGSLRLAAETLDVTQPTISRRIKNLEEDLGIPLFERRREGHILTKAGAELLPEARAVETAALRVEQHSLSLLSQLRETVRVGVVAGESAAAILASGLHHNVHGPQIELVDSATSYSTSKHAPEILVKHGIPENGDAMIRRVGSVDSAVYGWPKFGEGRSLPLALTDLAALPWLGYIEEQEHYITMRWLRKQMRDRPPVARLMSTSLMVLAAESGIGVAVLPCFLGKASDKLMRLSAPIEELHADFYTIANPDLARNSSIRAVAAWVATCFRTVEHQ